MIAFPALRPFTSNDARSAALERCELCGSPLGQRHRHVVELEARGVLCACQPCAILFGRADSAARFRTVPERVLADPAFAMTAQRWTGLGIPVGLAFFVHRSNAGEMVCCYPGPAGVTEAELDPGVWEAITAASSLADQLEDDVEALLVQVERGSTPPRCFLIPISAAYGLAGRLRRTWRGFSGGDEARGEIAAFFAELEHRGGRR